MSGQRSPRDTGRGRARHTTARLQELPPTVSIDEAGVMLGISRRSAYRAAARGEIPTLRLGRRLLVPTPRLLTLLGAGGDAVSPVDPARQDNPVLPRKVLPSDARVSEDVRAP
jgi:excisionase family DNA binding protein